MVEENKGTMLIILAIVAIVAIVGLILLFNGSITGAAIAAANSEKDCKVSVLGSDTGPYGSLRCLASGACEAWPNDAWYACNLPIGCGGKEAPSVQIVVPTNAAQNICAPHGGGKTCPVNDGSCDAAKACAYPQVGQCIKGVASCVDCSAPTKTCSTGTYLCNGICIPDVQACAAPAK